MPPPWLMYPHLTRGCIGWRMGYGEHYVNRFWPWFDGLSADQQVEYKRLFPTHKTLLPPYDECDDGEMVDAEEGMVVIRASAIVCFWEENNTPRYSREWLTQQGPSDKPFVMFWKPGEAGTPACLSQWQPSAFRDCADRYVCAEQYMMSEKARSFGDGEAERRIMATSDPATMLRLGRQVRSFEASTWDEVKHAIVLNGNYAKFSQDAALREYLLGTGDAVLVEASPRDAIWGIGLGAGDERALDPQLWRGQNMLGFALMEVRDEIARVWANYGLIDWEQYPGR